MNRRDVFRTVLALVVLQGIVMVVYVGVEKRREVPTPFDYQWIEGSRSVPDLSLERVDGTSVELTAFRGRPVLLHFWATWCPPCREELPELLEFAKTLPDSMQWVVLAVSVDADWGVVRDFFDGKISSDDVFRDPTGDEHAKLGVTNLPDTFLVSPSGRLVMRFRGARQWMSSDAKTILMTALEKSGDQEMEISANKRRSPRRQSRRQWIWRLPLLGVFKTLNLETPLGNRKTQCQQVAAPIGVPGATN